MPQHQEYKKKKVVAYLDFATIPSINMALHLIEHYDKEDADRILGLSRFELSDDVLKEVSKRGEVVFRKVSAYELDDFLNALYKKIESSSEPVVLDLHLILSHAIRLFIIILNTLAPLEGKYRIGQLYMYDDGSNEYMTLNSIRNDNIASLLHIYQEVLSEYIETKNYKGMYSLMRYVWHKFYPTQYIMLCPEYLSADEKMKPLKAFLGDTYTKMRFDTFKAFSPKKKQLFLKVMNFTKHYDLLKEKWGGAERKIHRFYRGNNVDFEQEKTFEIRQNSSGYLQGIYVRNSKC